MERIFQRLVSGLAITAFATTAVAGGSKVPTAGLDQIAESIELNPVIMTMGSEFKLATKPSERNEHGSVVIGRGIQEGIRYNCRTFYALSKTDMVTGPETASWYQFLRFGELLMDNEGYFEGGRIKTYGVHTGLNDEVWGQAPSKDYYEAIRIRYNGDVMIEGFAPEMAWISTVLGAIGLGQYAQDLLQQLRGLAIGTSILGAAGYITSYTFCPKSAQEPARRRGSYPIFATKNLEASVEKKIDLAVKEMMNSYGKGHLVK